MRKLRLIILAAIAALCVVQADAQGQLLRGGQKAIRSGSKSASRAASASSRAASKGSAATTMVNVPGGRIGGILPPFSRTGVNPIVAGSSLPVELPLSGLTTRLNMVKYESMIPAVDFSHGAKKYAAIFAALLKDSVATSEDYLKLYYEMGSDTLFCAFEGYKSPLFRKIAYKYAEMRSPGPEQLLADVIAARKLYPREARSRIFDPTGHFIHCVTTEYYAKVCDNDTLFKDSSAAVLQNIYNALGYSPKNAGLILFNYLNGDYSTAIEVLGAVFRQREILFSKSKDSKDLLEYYRENDAPRFRLLEKSLKAAGMTERHDSLLANPIYQQIVNTPK